MQRILSRTYRILTSGQMIKSCTAGMRTLIFADHNGKTISDSTLHVVTAAQKINNPITLIVSGNNCGDAAKMASTIEGVESVILADDKIYAHQLPENTSILLKRIMLEQKGTHFLCSTSSNGKSILPRLASLFDTQAISDVIDIKAPDTYLRPCYASNAFATVKSEEKINFLTVRPTAFTASEVGKGSAKIEVMSSNSEDNTDLCKWIKDDLAKSERPELTQAKVIVTGGRGMQDAEKFNSLYELADIFGGAVGASRAAVDAEFCSNDLQVGQTGKIVAPELYIAFGVSGAIQHIAGIMDAKNIVAINKDPEAPIFQVADYGIEGDLFKVLPEMIKLINEKKK